MKKESIWTKNLKFKNIIKLNKDIDVDVLIIGGGITGLTTAYYLKDSNLNVCIVEKNYIGMGVTSKTTGKINYLQETIYSDLTSKYSFETAKNYYESQRYAIGKIKKIIENENIKCNFDKVESYIFTNDKNEINKIKKEKIILEKLNCKVKEHKSISVNLKSKYAISVNDTYVFHPIKFLYSLKNICEKNNIKIYEQTKILNIKNENNNYICNTENNKIKAKKVIIACHYPFFLLPYMMPLKVYNEKSYITASITNKYKKETFITSKIPTKSIRYHKEKDPYLIYLSNSHSISNNLNIKSNFNKTLKEVKKLKLHPEYIWSNEDLITVDKIPYIGKIKKNNSNLLLGTGYNTWGMTNGILAGCILSDMVLGKYNKYESLTDPLRVINIVNTGNVLINIGKNAKGFIENKVNRNKKWYNKNIKFETRNGKDIAIYNDGKKEHIVYSTCPHMKCTLIFNEIEKTWDCPCHASRFDLDGKCIKGPSNYDISYKEKD